MIALLLTRRPTIREAADHLDRVLGLPQTLGTYLRGDATTRPWLADAAEAAARGAINVRPPRGRAWPIWVAAATLLVTLVIRVDVPDAARRALATDDATTIDASQVIGQASDAPAALLSRPTMPTAPSPSAAGRAAGGEPTAGDGGDGTTAASTPDASIEDAAVVTALPALADGDAATGGTSPAASGADLAATPGPVAAERPAAAEPTTPATASPDGDAPPAWRDLPVRYHDVARHYFATP